MDTMKVSRIEKLCLKLGQKAFAFERNSEGNVTILYNNDFVGMVGKLDCQLLATFLNGKKDGRKNLV
jgi:hypothetical protein